jgi:hypothetical protein
VGSAPAPMPGGGYHMVSAFDRPRICQVAIFGAFLANFSGKRQAVRTIAVLRAMFSLKAISGRSARLDGRFVG